MNTRLPLLSLLAAALLSGCALGPDFRRPEVDTPAQFRAAEGWTVVAPRDAAAVGNWWEIYRDPLLDGLVAQVAPANQGVAAAAARYREARALVGGSRAEALPTLDAGFATTRSRSAAGDSGTTAGVRNLHRFSLSARWEIDLWGRIARGVEASEHDAAASAADLAAVRLSAQAALVENYLELRINDAHQRLFDRTLDAYRRSLEITRNRHRAGVASLAEVAQAETQLRSAEAQGIDLRIQRSRLENAIAVLLGRPPAAFRIEAVAALPELPQIPPALPSEVLARRPDVAAALRRVAADNARIGAARAAFFPSLVLGAGGGYQDSRLADLFTLPQRFWSIGPTLAQSLFDGGTRRAAAGRAEAAWEGSVADYRQTVLEAFQDTEDSLASLRILAEESGVQQAATRAAAEFLAQTNNQYLAGTVSYLNVAIAQAAALSAERASLDLLSRQLAASVGLVRALGGDPWDIPADAAGTADTVAPTATTGRAAPPVPLS